MKDQATDVRVQLMANLKVLVGVIGNEEFDAHIIPSLIALSQDKMWRVKLALIQFIPQLTEFVDKDLFRNKLEGVMMGFLQDSVYQIREEAINLIIQMREKMYDQAWFENAIDTKAKEFHEHEKFSIRIHTVFVIQRVYDKVSTQFLNEKLCGYLLKLAEDPVPNIRFNVSKTIELLYSKLNNSNKFRCEDSLKKMEQEPIDFDVKYYAEKALRSIKGDN